MNKMNKAIYKKLDPYITANKIKKFKDINEPGSSRVQSFKDVEKKTNWQRRIRTYQFEKILWFWRFRIGLGNFTMYYDKEYYSKNIFF